jgi:predicted  nucleic acid-binding Zn-ribbon protein
MDEAREEDRVQKKQVKELNEISSKVSALSSVDKQVQKEIEKLKAEISRIESSLNSPKQKGAPNQKR